MKRGEGWGTAFAITTVMIACILGEIALLKYYPIIGGTIFSILVFVFTVILVHDAPS